MGFTNQAAFTGLLVRSFNFNYTSLAVGKGYSNTNFNMNSNGNYDNIKVVMFISCLGYSGAVETTTPFPPIMNMSYHITNSSYIIFDTVLGTNGTINTVRWHFNLIVYDEEQLRLAGMKTYYIRANFSYTDGG